MGSTHKGIRVYYDRVLVERIAAKAEYAPGIAVPAAFQRNTQEGYVVAVDPEGRYLQGLGFVPLRVKVGDRVMFGRHAGVEVDLVDGTTAFIVREDEIAGAIEFEPAKTEEPAA